MKKLILLLGLVACGGEDSKCGPCQNGRRLCIVEECIGLTENPNGGDYLCGAWRKRVEWEICHE